jgi:hypothetical protein
MLSKREINETQKLYQKELNELKETFPKQGVLTMMELAKVLKIDISTLRKKVKEGLELPKYVNVGTGQEKKSLRFTLEEVAKYVAKHNKKSDDKFAVSGSLLNELKAIISKIEKSKKLGDK